MLIPIPVLSIHKFQGANEIGFTDLPSVVSVKKSFALWDHGIVMSRCATYGQGSPSALAPRNRARKLPCVDSRSLVETSREVRAPVGRPLRRQAYPSVAIGARAVKELVVLPEPQLVFWYSANGGQPGARFPVGRVQTQRLLKFAASLASFACGT